mgnify:CR=1 FL=1|tara:strand:+ start:8487 stop:8765 length:279 start_codon:yes stop_codon:yes gene_type:complete
MEKTTPTTLVFYLDRELMTNADIFIPYSEFINELLASKSDNMIAIFIPTDGEERVECINPVMYKEPNMDKFNKIIDDIKANFQLGEQTTEGE